MLSLQRWESWKKKYKLYRTSIRYHTQLYFDTSSLHGVRYIKEKDRTFCEKFLWFSCTTIGGVACLIIIMSLWDKFQNNPTITGLDADTQTFIVNFPAVSLCPNSIVNVTAVEDFVVKYYKGDEFYKKFFLEVANMSYHNMENFKSLGRPENIKLPDDVSLADFIVKFARKCEDVISNCVVIGNDVNCCDVFKPQLTELGYCLAYNTRHVYNPPERFDVERVKETDDNMAITFRYLKENNTVDVPHMLIYLYGNDQMPTVDFPPQLVWSFRIGNLYFSEKYTYTTPETRQLTIRQRRCIFPDEIPLDTDIVYTYSACMIQCRMRLARKLCGCVPPFYKKICNGRGLKCLARRRRKTIYRNNDCHCELGCMNTRYDVERLQDSLQEFVVLELGFVSWPMYRYKREVLFGWVDLLVSFGGIAGLFLGFSLLSGVEVIYYFTMRACCMVCRDEEELMRLQDEYDREEKPKLDLSLTPYFVNKEEDCVEKGFTKVRPNRDSYKERMVHERPQDIFRVPYSHSDFLP
ncbi:sodium channel protein Nach [Anabrus simplex]|uniref:sodium channel protein Nach n=1 Tax=Anabrus simplex TaxID=316456 RepID=UPI0035A2EB77